VALGVVRCLGEASGAAGLHRSSVGVEGKDLVREIAPRTLLIVDQRPQVDPELLALLDRESVRKRALVCVCGGACACVTCWWSGSFSCEKVVSRKNG
jgi:hypothetical protein